MTHRPLTLNPDRLFPREPSALEISRRLFTIVESLPIISPHGHTDPNWFSNNQNFDDAASLLLIPDHYILRMLYSQGISLDQLRIEPSTGHCLDPRAAWRIFARNYSLYRGTPSKFWLDHTFATVFNLEWQLSEETADWYYDRIAEALSQPHFRPREILNRFNVQYLSTTEGALDDLSPHKQLRSLGWGHRIAPTFRPDDVLDPGKTGFKQRLQQLADISGEDTSNFKGYLNALRQRRQYFMAHGATATDHGPATPQTAALDGDVASKLYQKCLIGTASSAERSLFLAHMLTEMARMSVDDGMVMQLHAGSVRNHNPELFARFGPDKGADIPQRVNFVHALSPLLNELGNNSKLSLILFTLDESTYARELAPLAGHYPSIKLGPPWWFNDSPEGMLRFRRQVIETAGFYNTCGFNDDTRALLSIPARHDMARRMDCRFLAEWVVEGRLTEDEAQELILVLTQELVRVAYKLPHR